MKKANFYPYLLEFKIPGGTSRGVLHTKETFIIEIHEGENKGIGECGLFRGLSSDDVPHYEDQLHWLCQNINEDYDWIKNQLTDYPSIWFGYEQAIKNLALGKDLYFDNDFSRGKQSIKINGLIWMGEIDFILEQIKEKLNAQYDCIKLKIGINWEEEKKVISQLRQHFSQNDLEIRVDANGAFSFEKSKEVLQELADLHIHSIEQPIKAGQIHLIRQLCESTPTPIALDEELIGVNRLSEKIELLESIKPQFIILKPSLVGGFSGCDEWITEAEKLNINWWITSALESNIGLNAIAQYTFSKKSKLPQGLGTGGLFTNNFESNLFLKGDQLWHI